MKRQCYVFILLAATASVTSAAAYGQQTSGAPPTPDPSTCPMHERHEKEKQRRAATSSESHTGHLSEVNRRGEDAMGFSQTETTHHFRLTASGGAIEVEVRDARDTANVEGIKSHLKEIAVMFAAGDFTTPFAVHAQIPPGVTTMKRLKAAITYKFEGTERGGRVRITTRNAEALASIHDFLRFQIADHQTGDPTEVRHLR